MFVIELIDAAKADFGYPDSDDSGIRRIAVLLGASCGHVNYSIDVIIPTLYLDEEGDGKPISLKKGESIIHEDMVDPSTHQPLKTVDASTIQRQRVFTA